MKLGDKLRLLRTTYSKSRIVPIFSLFILSVVLVSVFQNCAPGKFKGGRLDSSLNILASEQPDCAYPSDPKFVQPNSLRPGATVVGYAKDSVYQIHCGTKVTRTCLEGGEWDGAPVYNSCIENCQHPIYGPTAPGTHYITWPFKTAATDTACTLSKVDSVCNGTNGAFEPTPAAEVSCTGLKPNCDYPSDPMYVQPTNPGKPGMSQVTGYVASMQSYTNTCVGNVVTRNCKKDGTWDGNPVFLKCDQFCQDPLMIGQFVKEPYALDSWTIFKGTTAECKAAKVVSVCNADNKKPGTFSPAVPSTRYNACTEVNPPTVNSFAASSSTITAGQSLTLSWNVTPGSGVGATGPGITTVSVFDGSVSTTVPGTSMVVSPTKDTTYTLTATFSYGGFTASGTPMSVSIKVNPVTCNSYPSGTGTAIPTGVLVNDTVTGYVATLATYPGLCGSKVTRTCQSNGTWSGGVPLYNNCTQQCVTMETGAVNSGTAFPLFYTIQSGTTSQCNAAKNTATFTCSATTGLFQTSSSSPLPTTRYATCIAVDPPTINSFAASSSSITSGQSTTLSWSVSGATSISISDGANPVAFAPGATSVSVSPTSNKTYTLTATNTISGFSASSTSTKSISVAAPTTCSYTSTTGSATPTGNTVGSTVTGYSSATSIYPNLCGSQVTRTCQSSGSWSGTVPVFTSCTQYCVSLETGAVPTGTVFPDFYTIQSGTTAECAAAKKSNLYTCDAATGLFQPSVPTARYSTCTIVNPPTISSFATSAPAINAGQNATLSWAVSGATAISISDGVSPAVFAPGATSVSVFPTVTTMYTLTATNTIGSFSATSTSTVTVSVNAAVSCVYPSVSGSATPTGTSVGSTVTGFNSLVATYPNLCGVQSTKTCLSTGAWSGTVPVYATCTQQCVSTETGAVNAGTVFPDFFTRESGTTAECAAAKKSNLYVCTATGLFAPSLPTARYSTCTVVDPPTIVSFSADTPTISAGGSANLNWTVTGASLITISDGTNPVAFIPGTTTTTVSPTVTTTYTLTATFSSGGFTSSASTLSTTVTVNAVACAYTPTSGSATPTGSTVGSTVTGYVAAAATYPNLCGAQVTRTCLAGGVWSDTVPVFTSCAQSCLLPGTATAVPAGTTFTYYTAQSGTTAQCAPSTVTCDSATGDFTGLPAMRYSSCTIVDPPVIVSFTSDKSAVMTAGNNFFALSWNVSGATSVVITDTDINGTTIQLTISGNSISINPSGSTDVKGNHTFTLTATYSSGGFTSTAVTKTVVVDYQ